MNQLYITLTNSSFCISKLIMVEIGFIYIYHFMKKLFPIVLSVFLIAGVLVFASSALAQTATSTSATSTSSTSTGSTLSCGPSTRTIQAGQSVTLTATGGSNNNYSWSITGLPQKYTTPTVTLTYPNPGTSTVTLTSGSQIAVCSITVLSANAGAGAGLPGMPGTGEGGEATKDILWISLSAALIAMAVYAGSRYAQSRQK
jgi:plastocyanin